MAFTFNNPDLSSPVPDLPACSTKAEVAKGLDFAQIRPLYQTGVGIDARTLVGC
jgi:hypothetical protein